MFDKFKLEFISDPEAKELKTFQSLQAGIRDIHSFHQFPESLGAPVCRWCDLILQLVKALMTNIYQLQTKDTDRDDDGYIFREQLMENKQTNGTDYALVVEQMAENGDARAQYAMGQVNFVFCDFTKFLEAKNLVGLFFRKPERGDCAGFGSRAGFLSHGGAARPGRGC